MDFVRFWSAAGVREVDIVRGQPVVLLHSISCMLAELESPGSDGTSSVFAICIHWAAGRISTHSVEGLLEDVYVGLISEQMES